MTAAFLPALWAPIFAVLIVAFLAVAYILIGYPLLLACFPGRLSAPVRKDPAFHPRVSILLAVHNGASFIAPKLQSLLALHYPADLLEIIVVSDGSTDRTEAIVEECAGRRVRLLRVPRGGKAAALNAALSYATGEIIFFTDVRQIIDPDALQHLAANFADPTVGAVTGELRMLDPSRPGEQADMELYWRYELWARRHHSRIDSIFSVTGCLYALRRSLAAPLPPDTLADDALFSLRAFFHGYRVIFEPAALAYDYPPAGGGEFRRKLRTLAGLWQIHARMPRLFTGANRMRFHFLSHKFSRLLLPWILLLIAAATIALPGSALRTGLLMGELLLLVVALLDRWVPQGWPLKRVSSLTRTFFSMNLAALLSVAVFFVRPEILWKAPTQVAVTPPDPRQKVARRES